MKGRVAVPTHKGNQSPMSSGLMLEQAFGTVSELIRTHATERPDHTALQADERRVSYSELDVFIDRLAASLQLAGVGAGDVVAFCAAGSIEYVAAFLAILRIGAVAAPLPLTATAADLEGMVLDSGAKLIFMDHVGAEKLDSLATLSSIARVSLDEDSGAHSLSRWMSESVERPTPVTIDPESPANIIYSSGTTGTPKGIVQPHRMRWAMVKRSLVLKYDRSSITMIATPPYSNLTIGLLLSTLLHGGTAVLLFKFDALTFLQVCAQARATHAFLVPVQYRRMLEVPTFEDFDLSSLRMSIFGGAPTPSDFKLKLIERWPGELVELFGMTEGGAVCLLFVRDHLDKLHTVGRPIAGHDLRILNEDGIEAVVGEIGEVVGRSGEMMSGYHNLPAKTREVEWHDASGARFTRTGDIGRLDEDGFLILLDRKKDMIISGGANVYPTDLESVLLKHEAVTDAAVVGMPSDQWGETPVAFVVLSDSARVDTEQIRIWANARLGKTQRIAAVAIIDELPRGAIGKVLKRALKDIAVSRDLVPTATPN